jgi:hypothetical protein
MRSKRMELGSEIWDKELREGGIIEHGSLLGGRDYPGTRETLAS